VAFKPINARNAIKELALSLHLDRMPTDAEVSALKNAHRVSFLGDLPKIATGDFKIFPVPGVSEGGARSVMPAPMPKAMQGLTMTAYNRDGGIEHRLQLRGNVLTVNLLVYTGWGEVWRQISRWLDSALKSMTNSDERSGTAPLKVRNFVHQIIDEFRWEGLGGDATAKDFLLKENERMPSAALNAVGIGWHATHSTNTPYNVFSSVNGSLIDWLNCDLGDDNGNWRLMINNILELRLQEPIVFTSSVSDDGQESLASRLVHDLHERNKSIIRSLVKADTLEHIGMGAAKKP